MVFADVRGGVSRGWLHDAVPDRGCYPTEVERPGRRTGWDDEGMTARWDFFAIAGTAICVVMAISYLAIVDAEGSSPAYWFVVLLVGTACVGLYAARKDSPRRRPALLAAAVVAFGLGVVSLLSIGPPLVVAAVCLLVASLRATRDPVAGA